MKAIMNFNIAIILVLLSFYSERIYPQFFKKEDVKYISIYKILEADKNKYIPYPNYKIDSIETINYDSYLWFTYLTNSDDKYDKSAVYAYNEKSKVLYKIGNINGIDYYATSRLTIHIFNNELFYYSQKGLEDAIGYVILNVIDRKQLKLKKQILLRQQSQLKDYYISGDTLYVEVQPMKKKLNWDYYILYFWPRGRSDKWELYEDGNRIRYAFDKDFNIIKEEEIKTDKVSK
jgi:hypothetical protein